MTNSMLKRQFPPAWFHVASFVVSLGFPAARAANLYWDGSSTGADADGGAGTWSAADNINWNDSATAGSSVPWTDGSDAVFGGTGGLVTVAGGVGTTSLTFQSTGYSLSGGSISLTGTPSINVGGNDVIFSSTLWATAPITKTGSGILTLFGANSFRGKFTVAEGTVKIASSTMGLGPTITGVFGLTTIGTTISPGATLDLNGNSIGHELLTFSGEGVDGAGAIVNHDRETMFAIESGVTLAGPATVGGTSRWDFRAYSPSSTTPFRMGGHTLTKVGSGSVHLVHQSYVATPGNIDIQEGSFWVETTTDLKGSAANTITVREGATMGVWGTIPQQLWSVNFEPNSSWHAISGARWDGPVSLSGPFVMNADNPYWGAAMTHHGVISGTGPVTKIGSGRWTLNSINTYSGGTFLNEGTTVLNAASGGAGTLRGEVTVNDGAILRLAVPDALGLSPEARISPLNVFGGLVENTSNGDNTPAIVNLKGGKLSSSVGVGDLAAESHFSITSETVINSLAADLSSVISGRLNFNSPSSGATTRFDVADGNAEHDLHINAAITESSPGHGITKTGVGLMALNGESLFTGSTIVEEGTLLVTSNCNLPHSPVTVKEGASFGTSTAGKSVASLTAEPGSSLVFPAQVNATTNIVGALALTSGNIGISPLLGADTVPGTYDLATAGQLTGTAMPVLDFAGPFGPTRASGSLAVNGNKLQLTLSGVGANLVWNNASGAGSAAGTWDTTSANFSHGGINDSFLTFDSVTFDDSVAPGSPKTITLPTPLAPTLIRVDNSNGDYTLHSIGGFAGAGSLEKTGSSTLTLEGPGRYEMAGSVTAGGGILDFGGKTISIDRLKIANGGQFNNATAIARSIDLQAGSSNATLITSGPWIKTTSGTVTLTSNNQLSGAGTVAAGELIIGNAGAPNAVGSLGTGPVTIHAGATLAFNRGDTFAFPDTFLGQGTVKLVGDYNGTNPLPNFTLTGDNHDFSGTLAVIDAGFTLPVGIETANDITLGGLAFLTAENVTIPSSFHLSTPGKIGRTSSSDLRLTKAILSGPISLTGQTSTSVTLYNFYQNNSPQGSENTISGPISESGGPASLSILSPHNVFGNVMNLSGASSYTGPTLISGPITLNLTGSLGATAVTVSSVSTIGGTGSIGEGGSLRLSSGSTLNVNASQGALTVNGNVTLSGQTNVSLDAFPESGGPIPILNFTGTLSGTASQLVLRNGSRYRKSEFKVVPGQIILDTDAKALIWNGSTSSSWNVGTKTWNTTGTGETESFYTGDKVLFDDTAVGFSVNGGGLEPGSVSFNNSNYYFVSANLVGRCPLIKKGTGTVYWNGPNAHTGGTFIEDGIFEGSSSSLGSGPVVISAAGTLAGGASGTGPATISGVLSPGQANTAGRSTITIGATTLTGTYACDLGDGFSDTLAVIGDLNLTGSTLILNAGSLDGKPFYTIVTYTGTLTGAFSSVTGLPSGCQVHSDAANKRIIVRAISPFNDWIDQYPSLVDTSQTGDPDCDGISNLIEFVIGGDPTLSDSTILLDYDLSSETFLFRYQRSDLSKTSTTQTVQWSGDFITWNDIPVTLESSTSISISPNGALPDDIIVSIPRATGKVFVRLKVSQP